MDCGLVPTRGGFSGTISFPEHFASNWVTVSLPAYAATKFLLCMDLKERESDKVIMEEKKLLPVKYEKVTRTLFEVCQVLLKLKPHWRVRPWRTWRETHRDSTQHRNACINKIPFRLPVGPVFIKLQTLDLAESSVLHDVQNVHVRRPLETHNTVNGEA